MKMITKKIGLGAAALVIFSVAISSCAMEGRVLEEGTLKPIERAIVVATWRGSQVRPAHASSICYHVETTTTDIQGRYRIPRFSGNFDPLIADRTSGVDFVYKAGYQESPKDGPSPEITLLSPFKGTTDQRFEYLSRNWASTCATNAQNKAKILILWKAHYEEAKQIAETAKQRKTVEGLLVGLEALEFGWDVDQKNEDKRNSEAEVKGETK